MPYDPDYANCKLLLHCNGVDGSTMLIDSSNVASSFTASGDAQIDTSQSKFGGASALFDGNDYFEAANTENAFDFESSDFTISFWMRSGSGLTGRQIIGRRNSSGVAPWAFMRNGGWLEFWASFNNSSWANGGLYLFRYSVGNSVFNHIAVTRSGSTFRMFVNGTEVASFSNATAFTNSAMSLRVGGSSGSMYVGHLDEIAIWKGVAKWTSNFTPPTSEWTNVPSLSGINKQIISY